MSSCHRKQLVQVVNWSTFALCHPCQPKCCLQAICCVFRPEEEGVFHEVLLQRRVPLKYRLEDQLNVEVVLHQWVNARDVYTSEELVIRYAIFCCAVLPQLQVGVVPSYKHLLLRFSNSHCPACHKRGFTDSCIMVDVEPDKILSTGKWFVNPAGQVAQYYAGCVNPSATMSPQERKTQSVCLEGWLHLFECLRQVCCIDIVFCGIRRQCV
mmetsp:Transcript_27094/g.62685  ORF Transcript_27094/g.62685 Transcript_27094/m.62685 type:complete len:211 (+) Transcript_27094:313-945(+)